MHSAEKKKDLKISNLSVHFRKLEKEEQFWPKANRRKESDDTTEHCKFIKYINIKTIL